MPTFVFQGGVGVESDGLPFFPSNPQTYILSQ